MLIIHPIFPLVKLVPVLSDKTVHFKKKKRLIHNICSDSL